ncbi:glycoside hydrolase family 92 protein [Neurospora crassa]|uniref:Alpha-1,2-mannosidase subfamily n=1 Tax=Neurospora crassa (strain ATCC 24698 / 74-OR23-1A / CBS 708.71 / DSM 1257 / FGSC 987) TaxID=367110 RepID=Q7S6N7_NEUCR|nr:alpha-1,2-mannosidase subfamily [Neurospora crassa OR74A]EAA31188.1 alpha-1,2-mannosidase subfamily [Neurospora crassa OR74A]KHE88999.1 glycoside hydrolase family 92 protein [Neurospora crassa]|eukprot:XP_960424.1 alpha-1,2-mannosidase subfamily [Neurospora crassa OR74A]
MAMNNDSPYRQAAAKLPVYLASVLRKRRAFLFAVLFTITIFFLFSPFSPDIAGSYGKHSSSSPSYGAVKNHNVNDFLRFIDPLIGTTNGGHVFPGATLPYGMAKAVADTASPAENAAGFVSDDNPITGFSHMHDSGTGGQPSLGNFPLFVHPGCVDDDYTKCDFSLSDRPLNRVPDSVYASPGYFTVNITNGVRAEMTTTHHSVLYRFSFPGTEAVPFAKGVAPYSPLILVDLVDLMNSRSRGNIKVDPETGRIMGDGRYGPSFGSGHYHAYFCADFKGAKIRKTGTFESNKATDEKQLLEGVGWGSAGAWIQFEKPDEEMKDSILARVGVSFMSVDKACENAEREMEDWDFERVERDAREAWREKLDVVRVDANGTSEELQTTFWSGLYRTLLSPQNYTGENPLWNSSEPYFDSFYCIWDSFRAQHPLLTVIDPKAQTEMIRALIDIYRHEGKLPDCRMSFCKGYTQGGSNADVVIADAFVKGLTADIDWKTAYEAVLSDAEIEPRNWGLSGRGNLVSWHDRGYIPQNDVDTNGTGPASRSISRGVEYAYNDFCISLLSQGLSKSPSLLGASSTSSEVADSSSYRPNISTPWTSLTADITKYHHRGANWRNYWNPSAKDLFRDDHTTQSEDTPYFSGQNVSSSQVPKGYTIQSPFVGFLQPRTLAGTFRYHPARTCSPIQNQHSCYYDTALDVYEGSPWLYSFFAPQSMSTLIRLMGGADTFVKRLEYYHSSGIAYMGNEQSFLTVFQFHYAGRPGLSSKWLRNYIPQMFNASVNGIPGNDDCAMGAFTTWGMGLGVFPVAGQDVYLIVPPFFKEVKVRAGMDLKASSSSPSPSRDYYLYSEKKKEAKWAVIRTVNFDAEMQGRNGGKPVYIQSAKLNGKKYTKNWITHEFFEQGGLLELVVGPEESLGKDGWGTNREDLPPSYYEDEKFWEEWERMDRERTERWKEEEKAKEEGNR